MLYNVVLVSTLQQSESVVPVHIAHSISQSCLTLCNPMDCSTLGSSVLGIFQARILKRLAISYSRRSFQPKDKTHVSWVCSHWWADSSRLHHLGSTRMCVLSHAHILYPLFFLFPSSLSIL